MKNLNISALALALGMAFSVGAMADSMSKRQYKAQEKHIAAEFKEGKASCKSLSGNANDICVADAKGRKSVALADLEDAFKPTIKTRYQARVARAEAAYAVSNEKCDDKAGNDKDVCVKEAKAAKVGAIADADAQMKTTKADDVAMQKSADANATAMEKATDAHKDAAIIKRDADYTVAKEKCAVFAGDLKDRCLSDAKFHFGPV